MNNTKPPRDLCPLLLYLLQYNADTLTVSFLAANHSKRAKLRDRVYTNRLYRKLSREMGLSLSRSLSIGMTSFVYSQIISDNYNEYKILNEH